MPFGEDFNAIGSASEEGEGEGVDDRGVQFSKDNLRELKKKHIKLTLSPRLVQKKKY